jgi:hypothetical protein
MNECPLSRVIDDAVLTSVMKYSLCAPPGALVEIGVYRGGTAWHMAEIARMRGSKLYLYDTFTGIPHARPEMGDAHKVGDFGDADLDNIRRHIPDANIIVGVFPDSLVPMDPVAFVHCDCDQYESVRAVCLTMPPLMVFGGTIILDDYNCLQGANTAVNELFEITEFTPEKKAIIRIGVTKQRTQ